MRRFLCLQLPGPGASLRLEPGPSHHLLRVTGVAPGERVLLFDGAGNEAEASLVGVEDGLAVLHQEAPAVHRAPPAVHLLVAVSKHAAMDTVMRMATELGATSIHPLLCQRSIARGDRSQRWTRIATSAATQCGRAEVPEVLAPVPLEPALQALPDGLERRIYTPGAPRRAPARPPCALLLGPEGGFTEAEVELARAHGFVTEGLGRTTLRADTAVVAALARLG